MEKTPSTGKKHLSDISKNLNKKFEVSIGAVIALVVIFGILTMWKVPYQAKEKYVETQIYQEPVTQVKPDLANPRDQRVCVDTPSRLTYADHYVYGKVFGLNGYKCYAEFRVTNHEDYDGKWTFRYVFNSSGMLITTDPLIMNVPKLASIIYRFESDKCQQGDRIQGYYELVDGPTTPSCHYETVYLNKTVTTIVEKTRTIEAERVVTKYETLLQKILSSNRFEKV